MDKVNRNPFQKDQCHKIFMVLGMPSEQKWPGLKYLPDYAKLKEFTKQAYVAGCCVCRSCTLFPACMPFSTFHDQHVRMPSSRPTLDFKCTGRVLVTTCASFGSQMLFKNARTSCHAATSRGLCLSSRGPIHLSEKRTQRSMLSREKSGRETAATKRSLAVMLSPFDIKSWGYWRVQMAHRI
jgi:hypothetical protein